MPREACPVCGDPFEFFEETAPTAGSDIEITHDIDQLCSVEDEIRWDRICHRATADGPELTLETYRHHWQEE
ncbi:MAG: hypothetical protein R3324_04270 [Halobacteriales archaeon]|nr:hypothetical protein [Halobacteriales archaeon]